MTTESDEAFAAARKEADETISTLQFALGSNPDDWPPEYTERLVELGNVMEANLHPDEAKPD